MNRLKWINMVSTTINYFAQIINDAGSWKFKIKVTNFKKKFLDNYIIKLHQEKKLLNDSRTKFSLFIRAKVEKLTTHNKKVKKKIDDLLQNYNFIFKIKKFRKAVFIKFRL